MLYRIVCESEGSLMVMFSLDGITLRPLEPAEIPLLYPWHVDYELDMFTFWAPRRSLEHFVKRYEERILEPDEGVITFAFSSRAASSGESPWN
jgi:hypothetical protein